MAFARGTTAALEHVAPGRFRGPDGKYVPPPLVVGPAPLRDPKTCENCGVVYGRQPNVGKARHMKGKYCSSRCFGTAMSRSGRFKAENNPQWRGTPSYSAIHYYVGRRWPRSGRCERCPYQGRTHWANLDGRYDRDDRSTWAELCPKCHGAEDAALAPRGEANGWSKLTDAVVQDARIAHHDGGESVRVLAARHGVVPETMRRALSGETWAHVEWAGF